MYGGILWLYFVALLMWHGGVWQDLETGRVNMACRHERLTSLWGSNNFTRDTFLHHWSFGIEYVPAIHET